MVTTQGRACRAEFWWFFLAVIAALVLFKTALAGLASFAPAAHALFKVATLVCALALVVSLSSCLVRRLHDVDKSGWNLWWCALPVVGLGYVIFLLASAGNTQRNEYGFAPGGDD